MGHPLFEKEPTSKEEAQSTILEFVNSGAYLEYRVPIEAKAYFVQRLIDWESSGQAPEDAKAFTASFLIWLTEQERARRQRMMNEEKQNG